MSGDVDCGMVAGNIKTMSGDIKHRKGWFMKFQIRFTDKDGCGTFRYFDAESLEEAYPESEVSANEYIRKVRERDLKSLMTRFAGASKMPNTVSVVEYDVKTQRAKRGGIKFKLGYCYVQATYKNGLKEYISESYSVKRGG
jgi:hypothetical protein